jgi:hypothetical protein
MNRTDEALPIFRRVFTADPNWKTLTTRLPKAGILPDDPQLIRRLTNAAAPTRRQRTRN